MEIEVIGVEGSSPTTYLKETLSNYSVKLGRAAELVADWQGLSQVEKQLGYYRSLSMADTAFVVFDSDLFARPGRVPSASVANHPLSFTFRTDFEDVFPSWMIAEP